MWIKRKIWGIKRPPKIYYNCIILAETSKLSLANTWAIIHQIEEVNKPRQWIIKTRYICIKIANMLKQFWGGATIFLLNHNAMDIIKRFDVAWVVYVISDSRGTSNSRFTMFANTLVHTAAYHKVARCFTIVTRIAACTLKGINNRRTTRGRHLILEGKKELRVLDLQKTNLTMLRICTINE